MMFLLEVSYSPSTLSLSEMPPEKALRPEDFSENVSTRQAGCSKYYKRNILTAYKDGDGLSTKLLQRSQFCEDRKKAQRKPRRRLPTDRHYIRNFKLLWSTLPPTEQLNLAWKRVNIEVHTADISLRQAMKAMRAMNAMNGRSGNFFDFPWAYSIWDGKRLIRWRAPVLRPRLPRRQERGDNGGGPLLLEAPPSS